MPKTLPGRHRAQIAVAAWMVKEPKRLYDMVRARPRGIGTSHTAATPKE